MKNIILDIETIPQSAEALEALMPDEIAKPVMPIEIDKPIEPDWSAKCPKYGGDAEKRDAWIKDSIKKWVASTTQAREKWQASALEARAKFIETAALRAESGHVKMIGLSVDGDRTIYLWEPDRKLVDIAQKEATESKVALFAPFMREEQMLDRFAKDFTPMISKKISEKSFDNEGRQTGEAIFQDAGRVITFYGNTFDLPFIARRAAICSRPEFMAFLRSHRRGRYLNAEYFVDIHEDWTAGDRETKTGGLDGLAKILGIEIGKNGDGATFYHWWKTDPAEGVRYLLNDLSLTEECAKRMGVL